MEIYIPSLGRADKLASKMNTVWELPRSWLSKTALVVVASEAEAYRRALKFPEVRIMVSDASGIAETRLWISKNATDEKILMLDDDIKFQVRMDLTTTKFDTHPSEESKTQMLDACAVALDRYAHIGISDRVAGSRAPAGADPPLIVENVRLIRALGYRRTEHLSCEHGRVPVMEDFDVALQLLKRGFPSGCVSWWVQDQRATQWKGGCSTYRTHNLHEMAAQELARLHPGLVRLRQKENKTGGDFGSRTEVTIAWKKAIADR